MLGHELAADDLGRPLAPVNAGALYMSPATNNNGGCGDAPERDNKTHRDDDWPELFMTIEACRVGVDKLHCLHALLLFSD